jgi:hypothetical protein
MPICRRYLLSTLLAILSASIACTRRETASLPPLELSLYLGVQNLVRLSDTESEIMSHARGLAKKGDVSPALTALKFTQVVGVETEGVRAYLRNGRVALIELQEPFKGGIQGKKIKLFPFTIPPGKSWDEALIREFGEPELRASGGSFGSEALFYSWGDISYNRMGPNQIAVYRDPDIAQYRKQNFGREIRFWSH